MTARVSVIIPACNRETLVIEALESVFAQTYRDFHVFVADDGSTDGTLAVLRSFAEQRQRQMTVLASGWNRGQPATINSLLDVADGELIAYLDSDDLWLPTKLEKQVAFMDAHPEVVYSFHDVDYVDAETGRSLGTVSEIVGRGRGRLRGGDVRAALDTRLAMSSPSIMVRCSAIGETRRDTRFVCEDLLWDVDILAKGGRLDAMNEVLARYRRHDGNMSRSGHWAAVRTEEMLALLAVIEARYPHLARASRPYRRKTLITAIAIETSRGDPGRARTIGFNALRSGLGPKPLAVYLGYRLAYRHAARFKSIPRLERMLSKLIYS